MKITRNELLLDARKTIQHLRKSRTEHNCQCPTISVTRTTEVDGETNTVTFERKVNVFKQGYLDTAQKLISMFVRNHNEQVHTLKEVTELVPVKTSNPELARNLGISDRTVRNHLKWLIEYGFLQKQWHGSKAAFDLYITPSYLINSYAVSVTEIPKFYTSENGQYAPLSRKNFPHILTNKNQGTEIEIKKVEELDNSFIKASKELQSNMDTVVKTVLKGQKERLKRKKETHVSNEQNEAAAAAQTVDNSVDKSKNVNKNGLIPSWRQVQHFMKLNLVYQGYVVNLWNYAHAKLYANREFNENELLMIKSDITKGVFGNFKYRWDERKWDEYLRYCYKAVDYVENYLERHPEKYLPAPYAHSVEGKGYFDYENKYGFQGAFKWIHKNINQRKEEESNRKLKTAIKHMGYAKHNDSRLPARFATMSFSQIYNFYAHHLEENYGKAVSDNFKKLVSRGSFNYVPKARRTTKKLA